MLKKQSDKQHYKTRFRRWIKNNNIENTLFLGIGFLLGYLYKSYTNSINNSQDNKNLNYKVDVFDNKNNPIITNYYIDDKLKKIFFENTCFLNPIKIQILWDYTNSC